MTRMLLAGIVLSGTVLPFFATAQDAVTMFAEAQALRGQALYDEHCVLCHGAQLQGAAAAALSGATFRARWADGQHTVDDLFYIVRTQMPYSEPGKLSRQQYIDVIAYVLKVNGYPAGDGELPLTAAVLKQMTLQAK